MLPWQKGCHTSPLNSSEPFREHCFAAKPVCQRVHDPGPAPCPLFRSGRFADSFMYHTSPQDSDKRIDVLVQPERAVVGQAQALGHSSVWEPLRGGTTVLQSGPRTRASINREVDASCFPIAALWRVSANHTCCVYRAKRSDRLPLQVNGISRNRSEAAMPA